MNESNAIDLVVTELVLATNRFGRMASTHEAIAVIREEYLELERAVFHGNPSDQVEEAKQLAAMAIRFLMDTQP